MGTPKEQIITEDDDDLEFLRLAALQSLKKKSGVSEGDNKSDVPILAPFIQDHFVKQGRPHKGFGGKRGKYFGGRGSKNGHFTNRARLSNLISITPVARDEDKLADRLESSRFRPQDKYSTAEKGTDFKEEEGSSKFDRYNESDNSEDETDEDTPKHESDDNSSPKLKRSDSFEQLMQELDNEIQGRSKKDNQQQKVQPKVKKEQVAEESEDTQPIKVKNETMPIKTTEEKDMDNVKTESSKEPASLADSPSKDKPVEVEPAPIRKRKRSFPPRRDYHGFRRNQPQVPYPEFYPNMPPLPYPVLAGPPAIFNPAFGPSPILMNQPIVPFYERPLSPLLINADTLQTQTRAPLSPRSAAFVLENRAIIERRKRSPRRSYSRSPSPRRRSPSMTRRSLSPRRRSRSPKRRSKSPRRKSISPKMGQFSPKRRPLSPTLKHSSPKISNDRPLSPKQRSVSPKRKDKKDTLNSPKNKPSIRDRLGYKASAKSDAKENSVKTEEPKKSENKTLDPVLEARKKKFESREIKVKEGVIRLKPKDESKTETKEDLEISPIKKGIEEVDESVDHKNIDDEFKNDDILIADDALDLEPKIDLFSDEESDVDSEGRFKVKEEGTERSKSLPFSKLDNGIKSEPNKRKSSENSTSRRSVTSQRRSKREAPDVSVERGSKKSRSSRSSLKRIIMKSERHPTTKHFERKIEIKIKNPAKYEKEDKERTTGDKKDRGKKSNLENAKVEISDDDFDTEIVVENEDGEVENSGNDEDLRTQLSKKRAGKLSKHSSNEGGSSRLLQNAFQNVLPMKKPKRSKSQELSSSDGKLPIHLRLGTCSSEYCKTKRNSRKRKNVESEGQV